MGEHALLAPSSADRWVNCPGSVRFEAQYPEKPPHPMTEEGTAIHEVAAKVLQDFIERDVKGHTFKRADFLNTTASNGVVITGEMLDVAEVYIRDVMQVSTRFKGAKVLLEHRVFMDSIHPENWGTLDAAILFYDMDARELVVEDLKAGWGIVEVWDNWQLLDYVFGLLSDMLKRNWPLPEVIELRLVQPRPYHRQGPVRVQRIHMSELSSYAERLKASAYDALGPDPTFQAGKWCDHCLGCATCPAAMQAGYRVIERLRNITAQDLSGEALGKHLTWLDDAKVLLKALYDALEDKALIDIQQGRGVPGYEWASKESRVKWTAPMADVHAIGDLYGVELRVVEAPTPKQAITAGIPETVINSMSSSHKTGIKLVKADIRLAEKTFKPKG